MRFSFNGNTYPLRTPCGEFFVIGYPSFPYFLCEDEKGVFVCYMPDFYEKYFVEEVI